VWVQINRRLKRTLPWLHGFLKRRAASWQAAPAPLVPVLKRVRGEFFWTHPRVLTLETRDAEPHICSWILAHLPRGGTFFDVGAHCGWLSMKAARHVGRGGRVIAFEPTPVLLDILNYQQRRNRLPQMTVIGMAVSDSDTGHVPFYLLNGGLSFRNSLTIGPQDLPFLGGVEKTRIDVPALTLDTYCRTEGLTPDVIKIDVEGAEFLVLRGSSRILLEHHPVLIVSVHPYWLPPSQSTEQILEFLAGHGYRVRDSHVVRAERYLIGDYLLSA
jgi:FkbM family methyltransferase